MVVSHLSHPLSQVHRKGDLVETKRYWMLHDAVKLSQARCALSQDTSRMTLLSEGSLFFAISVMVRWINFDEPVKMRSYAGFDGALERSCVFFVTCETSCGLLAAAQATARVGVPTAPREFIFFEQNHVDCSYP